MSFALNYIGNSLPDSSPKIEPGCRGAGDVVALADAVAARRTSKDRHLATLRKKVLSNRKPEGEVLESSSGNDCVFLKWF